MRFPPCWEGAGQEGELSPQPPAGDAAPRAGGGGAAAPPPAGQHRGSGDDPACPGFASVNRHVVSRVPPEHRSLVAVAFENLSL